MAKKLKKLTQVGEIPEIADVIANQTEVKPSFWDKPKAFWGWIRTDKKRLIGAGVALAAVVFGIWYIGNRNSNKITYQTSTVQKGTVIETISASGKVLTTNTLSISTQASGVVKKVYVNDGDKVKAGQILATITLDSDGQLANLKASTSLSSAQNAYRTTQASLANVYDQIQGHATDESFSMIETRTKAEVSNDNAYNSLVLSQATYKLTSPVITAPFSGTVESVNLVEGMVLSSSTSTTNINSERVAVIKGDSLPVISVSLSEVDVPNVKVGQKVTVTLDSISDKTFTGKVATVDRVGSVSNNVTSYNANIKLDTDSSSILPNMAATADIIVNTATDALYIPSAALITQSGITYAKTLVNGKEVDVAVETGISSDTNTVITSGLTEGETVITGTTTGTSTTTTTRSVFSTGGFGGAGGGNVIRAGRGG